MSSLLTGLRAELLQMKRQPMVVVLMMAITLIYPIFVSQLYVRDQVIERPVVVVDGDDTAFSRKLTLALDATQNLRLVGRVQSLAEAEKMLVTREVDLVVVFPAELSARLARGQGAKVAIWSYAANLLTYGSAYPAVSEVVLDTSSEISARRLAMLGLGGRGAERAAHPLQPDFRYVFHSNVSYGAFLVPGVLLIVLQQVVLIGLAYSAGLRREAEVDAGASRSVDDVAQLIGRGLAQLPFHILSAALLIGAFHYFGWPLVSSIAAAVLFAAFLLALVPLGLYFATFTIDRYSAFFVLMFLSAPLLMISGYAMPSAALSAPLRAVANFFPTTPGLRAMQIVSQKSDRIVDILPELEHIAALSVIYFTLLTTRLAWLRTKSER